MASTFKFKPYVPAPHKPRKRKQPAVLCERHLSPGATLETNQEGAYFEPSEGTNVELHDEEITATGLTHPSKTDNMDRSWEAAELNSGPTDEIEISSDISSDILSGSPSQDSNSMVVLRNNEIDMQNQELALAPLDEPNATANTHARMYPKPSQPPLVEGTNVVNDVTNAASQIMSNSMTDSAVRLLRLPELDVTQTGREAPPGIPALSPGPTPSEMIRSQSQGHSPRASPIWTHDRDSNFRHGLDSDSEYEQPSHRSKHSSRSVYESKHKCNLVDQRAAKRPKVLSATVKKTAEFGPLSGHVDECGNAITATHDVASQPPSKHDSETNINSPANCATSHQTRSQAEMIPHWDTTRLERGQEASLVTQCNSCAIFRAALFEVLVLLQNPSHQAVPTLPRTQLRDHCPPRFSLRSAPTRHQASYEDPDDESVRNADDHGSESGVNFSDFDNDKYDDDDDYDKSSSLHGMSKHASIAIQRRRWTKLEDIRLRAWIKENKSEQWIARRLNRTASAVKQQLRKMGDSKIKH